MIERLSVNTGNLANDVAFRIPYLRRIGILRETQRVLEAHVGHASPSSDFGLDFLAEGRGREKITGKHA
jgi:hypothetical protein